MFINQYGYCSRKIETQYIEICPNVYIQLTIDAQRGMRRDRLSLHQLLEILKRGEKWNAWQNNRLYEIYLTTREGLGVTTEYINHPVHGEILSVTDVKPIGAWVPPSANWTLEASRNRARPFRYKHHGSWVINGICKTQEELFRDLNMEENPDWNWEGV